jgi:uncharacterized membrane protein YfcA
MTEAYAMPLALGACIGLVTGLTGAGGTVLAVPLLTIALGLTMQQAAAISLIAIALSAGMQSIRGLMNGVVRYKAAMLIAACGLIAAPAGVKLAAHLPQIWLKLTYAAVLLYVALLAWQRRVDTPNAPVSSACQINPDTSRFNWTMPCTRRMMLTGAGAGLLSGLLGVGGGFIIVPALQRISNLDHTPTLHTTLAAVALIAIGSLLLHGAHAPLAWEIALPFVLGMVVSMWLSSLLFRKIPKQTSHTLFATLALVAALAVLLP